MYLVSNEETGLEHVCPQILYPPDGLASLFLSLFLHGILPCLAPTNTIQHLLGVASRHEEHVTETLHDIIEWIPVLEADGLGEFIDHVAAEIEYQILILLLRGQHFLEVEIIDGFCGCQGSFVAGVGSLNSSEEIILPILLCRYLGFKLYQRGIFLPFSDVHLI